MQIKELSDKSIDFIAKIIAEIYIIEKRKKEEE